MLNTLTQGLADRYRLEREIGTGGMATVYLAHDIRHDRKVAIKVLHPELAAVIGAERFLAEIRTTANLQHPHILPLFDSGAVDGGLLYYVMPFIEGESLRQRLTRERQLPVADAARIASEVASALDYAHRKGIVHRDIKPENVLLHDGSALVADFGIALAVTAAGGGRLTQTGLSLGTPAYMSPEQAMGERDIGPRSDVYALGAVTYEMLSGEPPFTGPSSQAIVARTLTEQPRPLRTERKSIPAEVEGAVLQALEKLPADRQGSAKQFADEIAAPAGGRAGGQAVTEVGGRAVRRPGGRPWPWVIGSAAVAGLAFAGGRTMTPSSPNLAGMAVEFRPTEMGTLQYFSVSQDGKYLVGTSPDSNGVNHVILRRLSDAQVTVVPNTANALRGWLTPDNQSLVIRGETMLRIQPVSGGSSRDLMPVTGYVTVDWTDGDSMLVVSDEKVFMAPMDGTKARLIATLDSTDKATFYIPRMLPGGRNLLIGKRYRADSVALMQMDARTGAMQPVLPNVQEVRPYAPDRLVWLDGGGRVNYGTYDQATRRVGARQVVLNEGIDDFFANGDVIMLRPMRPQQDLWLHRAADRRSERIAIPDSSTSSPTFSPDGRYLAFLIAPLSTAVRQRQVDESAESALWIMDRRTGVRTRLLEDVSEVAWFPDGSRLVAFRQPRDKRFTEAWVVSPDRAPPPERVALANGRMIVPAVTPDGKSLMFTDLHSTQVKMQPLAGGPAQVLFDDPGREGGAVFSPDGRWFLYVNEGPTGAFLVARAWPSLDHRTVIAPIGFCPAMWGDGGRQVMFCAADGTLSTVAFNPATGKVEGTAQAFTAVAQRDPDFAVDPMGRDVAWIPASPRYGTEPRVLANWRGEAERRLGGR